MEHKYMKKQKKVGNFTCDVNLELSDEWCQILYVIIEVTKKNTYKDV